MNTWEEINEIQARHNGANQTVGKKDILFIAQEFKQTHKDRGQLLEFIEQFRPHPFDLENRETWPEFEKPIIVYPKLNSITPLLLSIIEVLDDSFLAYLPPTGRTTIWFSSIKSYQYLSEEE